MGLLAVVLIVLLAMQLACSGGIPLRLDQRCRILLAVAAGSQIAATMLGGSVILVPVTYVLGAVIFGRALWLGSQNRPISAIGFTGAMMNAAPIAMVGHMPTSLTNEEFERTREPIFGATKHGPTASSLGWIDNLGDWIRIDALQAIVSPGDVIMAAALVGAAISALPVAIRSPRVLDQRTRLGVSTVWWAARTRMRRWPR